ncbi:MAG: hypothetical protein PHT64_07030, partial [Bacteroidales bacterium]|nr:hypothetical protein [Bacteroidales bacterium]
MKTSLKTAIFVATIFLASCQTFHDAPQGPDQYLAGVHEMKDLNLDELYNSFGVSEYPHITSKLEYIISSRNFRA